MCLSVCVTLVYIRKIIIVSVTDYSSETQTIVNGVEYGDIVV